MAPTVWNRSASSSGIVMPNASSTALTTSIIAEESMPNSSRRRLLRVTRAGSTEAIPARVCARPARMPSTPLHRLALDVNLLRYGLQRNLKMARSAHAYVRGSSLGRLRFAVLLGIGSGRAEKLSLVDVKEAVRAAAPRPPGVAMPDDDAARRRHGGAQPRPVFG